MLARASSPLVRIPVRHPRPLASTLAPACIVLLCSYLLSYALGAKTFCIGTNLCFTVAGLQMEVVKNRLPHAILESVGAVAAPTLVYIMLGAASLSFHIAPTLDSTAHTLDIYCGWILLLHACYVTVSACILRYRANPITRTACALCFTVVLTLVTIGFETVYQRQLLFFAVFSALTFVACVYSALESVVRVAATSRRHAGVIFLECATISYTLFVAAASQCELFGVRHHASDAPALYGLYHGNWHFLICASTVTLYTRAIDDADARHTASVYHTLSLYDTASLCMLCAYGTFVIVCKEALALPADMSRPALCASSALLCAGVVTCHSWYVRAHASNTQTETQGGGGAGRAQCATHAGAAGWATHLETIA